MLAIFHRTLLFVVGFTLPLQAFRLLNVGGFGMTPFKLATAALLGLAALSFTFGRRRQRDGTTLWIAIFATTYAVSAVQGVLRGVTLQQQFLEATTVYLLLAYYLLIGFTVRTREDLNAVLWGLLAGGATTALPSVLGFQTASELGRHQGLSGQPNVFGIDMVIVVAVALSLFMASRSRMRKGLAVGVIAVAVAGIFLSLSRTAFVAGLAMWGLWMIRSRRIDTIQYVVPAAMLLAVVLLMAPLETRDRFTGIFDSSRRSTDGSIQSRFLQWELGSRAFLTNPAFGIGILHYVQWAREQPEGRGNDHVIHNAYMRIAVAQGLFGLIPYLMILVLSWRYYSSAARMARSRRKLRDPWLRELGRHALFLQLAMFAVIVAGMTAHTQKSKTGWLMIGLAPVVYHMAKKRAEELDAQAPAAPGQTTFAPFEPFPGNAPALPR